MSFRHLVQQLRHDLVDWGGDDHFQVRMSDGKTGDHPMFIFDNMTNQCLETLSNILTKLVVPAAKKINDDPPQKAVHIIAILDDPALFVEEFFKKIYSLDYPRKLMSMAIVLRNFEKQDLVSSVQGDFSQEYKFVAIVETVSEAINLKKDGEFVFFVRSSAQLDEVSVLKDLVDQDQPVLAPLLTTYDENRVWLHVRIFDMGWGRSGTAIESMPESAKSLLPVDMDDNTNRLKRIQNVNFYPWKNPIYLNSFQSWIDRFIHTRNGPGIKMIHRVTLKDDPFSHLKDTQNFKENSEGTEEKKEKPAALPPPIQYIENVIVNRKQCGIFRVLTMRDCYLVKSKILDNLDWPLGLQGQDEDTWFSLEIRKRGHSLRVLNKELYGQIVNLIDMPQNFTKYPELKRYFENHDLWQSRYIDPAVINTVTQGNTTFVIDPIFKVEESYLETSCGDAFIAKFFTPLFIDQLREEIFAHQELFKASTDHFVFDKTPDKMPEYFELHELDLEREWLAILKFYMFQRLTEMYQGLNELDGGRFHVVKEYEAPDVKYVNSDVLYYARILLRLSDDYESEGTEFISKGCSIKDPPKGSVLIHPPKITHMFHTLPVTRGTRLYLNTYAHTVYPGIYEKNGGYYLPGHIQKPESDSEVEEIKAFLVAIGSISAEQAKIAKIS